MQWFGGMFGGTGTHTLELAAVTSEPVEENDTLIGKRAVSEAGSESLILTK